MSTTGQPQSSLARPNPAPHTTQGDSYAITPIAVPAHWDDNGIILFAEFCAFIRTPERTVREWRRCGRGPTWHRFNGNGALYITVGELRRFLNGGV